MCVFICFFFFFQTLSLNKSSGGGEDVHQGFQNLLSEVNRTDTQYLLRTANRLFGEKTYDFLSVTHTPDCPKQIETEVVWRREAGLVVQTGLVGETHTEGGVWDRSHDLTLPGTVQSLPVRGAL